jgi:GT2 family glycosyltransferase
MLRRTLEALGRQEGAPPFEVIVVDDASTDETPAMLRSLLGDSPFPLIVLRQESNGGPAAARNRGWRSARGAVVCFTDDDCLPQSRWLATLVAGMGGADLAQGRTLPNPDQRDRWGPFSHTVEVLTEAGFYETCNMAYERSWLDVTGGFDEDFRFPYGEDTDLAWRAKEKGAAIAFVPEAIVYHEIGDSDFLRHLRLLRRRAALVHLLRLHPAARSLFPGRWYHKQTHPPALATAAALVVLARRPRSLPRWLAAVTCGGTYARTCLRTWRGPKRGRYWVAVIPLALVSDLTEMFILGRASVRERTFFL